jgi:hypothetical protein
MRRKRITSIDFARYTLAAATIGAATTAEADFIPPYSLNPPPNGTYTGAPAIGTFGAWTSTLAGTHATPTTNTTNAPVSLTLRSADDTAANDAHTANFDLMTTVQGSGILSFNWNFTEQGLFTAAQFGYTENGVFTSLATANSSGTATVPVSAGDVFGFRIVTNYASTGNVTISNFSAPIPEPTIVALIVTGAVGLIVLREARRRARAAMASGSDARA